jgi:hypothetical protein
MLISLNVTDPHRFQCGSGSSILGQCGSGFGSGSGSLVLMTAVKLETSDAWSDTDPE